MSEEFLSKSRRILGAFCCEEYAERDWTNFGHSTDKADVGILEVEDGYKLIVFCLAYAVVVKDGMVTIAELRFVGPCDIEFTILESIT